MKSRLALMGVILAGLAVGPVSAQQPPIRIGEINSYTVLTAFTGPYRKGVELAVDEINARSVGNVDVAGGIEADEIGATADGDAPDVIAAQCLCATEGR